MSRYIAVGQNATIYTSSDLITWTLVTTNITGEFRRIIHNEGSYYLAVGNLIYKSSDLTTWTSTTITSNNSYFFYGLLYSGSKYVAAGYGAKVAIGSLSPG